MITAWQIYWVMQLDVIRSGMVGVPIFAFSIAVFFAIASGGESVWNEEKHRLYGWVKPFLAILTIMVVSWVFIPSSKTVAAMIVLPAITSDKVIETVTPEARELYELAKDALRSVSKKEAPAEAPKEAAK